MTNKDKQYYIYLRSTNEKVPCTEQQFYDYYHDIDNYRRKQQRHGNCVCPARFRLQCDMDCYACKHRTSGEFLHLDDDCNTYKDNIVDESPLIEDMIAENERMEELFIRLNELMPQAMEIGIQSLNGLSDTSISELLGTPRKTLTDRIKRVKNILKDEFPEFF